MRLVESPDWLKNYEGNEQVQMNIVRVRRASIFYFIIASLTLGIVTPVLAAYLGPNRVVTEYATDCKVILYECQYVPSRDDYRYKRVDDWSCSNEGKPWKVYDSDPSPWGCSSVNEGHTYWEKQEILQEVTNTYPPATISSALQNCTLNNGWCNTAPVLSLSGIEPVAGYNILAIEGTLNGQTFACAGTNCSLPLSQGNNSFNFWALSSWGDTSEMGALNAKVDSQLPAITGTFSGNTGSNGWYLGQASFNGAASDNTSGLANFSCILDGSSLPSCNSFTVNSPGSHTILLTARDNAGNTRTLNQSISIDTQSPILNASVAGTLGSHDWFNAATLNASASDPTPGSGLAAFEYNQDGGGWVTFPASGELALPEGKHSVDIRAMDNAGQTVLASKSFWLDTVAPALLFNTSGTLGANNWYTTSLSLTASASDATSGIDLFEYQINGGSWMPYKTALTLVDGIHPLKFWAQDVSGLVTQENRTFQIDTRAPQINGSLSGVLGANGWYISNVTLSASASDPTPGSGLEAFTYTLDDTPENSYTSPLTIGDGRHTVELNAQDKAGLAYSMEQSFKVDTLVPTLSLQSILPAWISGNVTVTGTANDPLANPGQAGSGLSKVEISTDGGQVWQSATGTVAWSYTWNTEENSNGTQTVYLRVTDSAGLRSQQAFVVGVDNIAPKISLPDSWYQWDTVTLDIWDNHSGLSEARIEISDPEGRWPARKINLNLDGFPMDFKWDRRFGDGTVAPLGTYDVDVFAFDRLGNAARESASVNILLGILPAGPTSTALPYVRPESTLLPITTSVPQVTSALPATEIVSAFGAIPEPVIAETAVPEDIPSERETPAQTSVLDWLQSVFLPDANSAVEETVVGTPDETQDTSQSAASDTNVLWGATAAAMIGAATAYALDEKRKREEEIEGNRAAIEARIEEQEAKKIEAAEARKVQQWLEGQELLKEQLKEQQLNAAEMSDVTDRERLAAYKQSAGYQSDQERMEDWRAQQAKLKAAETADITAAERLAEYKNSDEYKERQAALEEYHHEQRVQSADAARWAGLASQGEYAANLPPENWWEKTKSFVQENVIEPFHQSVYVPFIEPVVEQTKDAITSEITWINETIYTPYIAPKVEEVKQKWSDDMAWINEHFYQPFVAPNVEKAIQAISNGITWLNDYVYQPVIKPYLETELDKLRTEIEWFNENVYQPHLQPLFTSINEGLVQPFIQPMLETVKDTVSDWQSWVNINVYQPIFKPVVDDAKDVWAEYGEWVHNALDAVGFIPGLGDIADGLNGVIYLAEGHYIEASVSLLAMIPLIGDLGKIGKLTAEVAEELVEEAVEKVVKETAEELVEAVAKETVEEAVEKVAKETVEEVAEKIAKETGEELVEKTAKETIEEAVEKTSKEAVEELTEKVAKETVAEVAEKVIKETGEELVEGTTKEVVEKTTREVTDNIVTNIARDTVVAAPATALKEASQTIVEETAEEAIEQISEEATQRVLKEVIEGEVTKLPAEVAEGLTEDGARELAEKISTELGGKKVWVSAKTGSVYVSSPPAEGFALVEQLSKIDLTNKAEVEKILHRIAELTSRGSGNHVILGPFKPNGAFIQEALDTGGVFWDVGDELWEALDKTGIDMFSTNDQFLRVQMERGIERFDIIKTDVYEVIDNINDSPPIDWKDIKYTEKEIMDLATMPDSSYQLVDNSWVRVDLVK